MKNLPSFDAFFEAVHGYAPFPWQTRLSKDVLGAGWPELLDLPTGVGKTSAIDVALYALAVAPERMPRRTLLVVDRRIVVDQAAEHARGLLERFRAVGKDTAAGIVAERLRGVWGASPEEDPFAVAVLRGGMPRDNDWARRPDQPVVGVSTVDQVGSRLLFRGYGTRPSLLSIQAGLIGNDTLFLLDEVHLSTPFAETLEAVQKRFRKVMPGIPDRFAVVRMSATARSMGCATQSFKLAEGDRRHPTLSRRLSARKLARLLQVKVRGEDEKEKRAILASAAVSAALELQQNGARVVAIVLNRVDTARLARRLLAAEHGDVTDALLVTGRMRPIDRDRLVRDELMPRAGAGRTRSSAVRPLVVVATQSIEAGADLDFDGLVTECASLDALRQRFGRLDRRGELRESPAVIIARSDSIGADADDPVYGTALSATWGWLQERAEANIVDFGVDALPAPLDSEGQLLAGLLAPVEHAPVLLPAHLDAWSQTSPKSCPDPDVSLWLHGAKREGAEVQIVWRADIEFGQTRESCMERLSACRPSTLEAVSLPLAAARAWLQGRRAVPIADVVAAPSTEEEKEGEEAAGSAMSAFRWAGDDSDWTEDPRPGDVLVVPSTRGGVSSSNFDPDDTQPVLDLGDLAQLRGRGVASLRLTPAALAAWGIDSNVAMAMPTPSQDESLAEARSRIVDWFSEWPEESPGFYGAKNEWQVARASFARLNRGPLVVDGNFVVTVKVSRSALSRTVELEDAISEDDDSSFRQQEVTLRRHSTEAREFAERFARAIGLSGPIIADLGRAAWLHDVGKADPRFQRWLVGGSDISAASLKEPLAKSALPPGNARDRELARTRAGYPKGYRHELLSLAMIQDNEAALAGASDRDLVLHLVASHHGWCRPFAPFLDHPDELKIALDHQGPPLTASTRHRLARLDSGVSDRFWGLVDRYGWWGLAWLEAVLRLADHRASELEAGGAP